MRIEHDGPVRRLRLDRPARLNALDSADWAALAAALGEVAADPAARVLVLCGAGRAFCSGTDAALMAGIADGEYGQRYEDMASGTVTALRDLEIPTVAVLHGACTGAGLLLAAACDLRLAADDVLLGVPIARTMGNCLSASSLQLLCRTLGEPTVRMLLLRGRLLGPAELAGTGFLAGVRPAAELDEALAELLADLLAGAPLTQRAVKTLLRRLAHGDRTDADVVRAVYGSTDFRHGVRSFLAGTAPMWEGR